MIFLTMIVKFTIFIKKIPKMKEIFSYNGICPCQLCQPCQLKVIIMKMYNISFILQLLKQIKIYFEFMKHAISIQISKMFLIIYLNKD